MKKGFKMPTPMKISGRTSTMTHAFITSIIPQIEPSEQEIVKCLSILEIDPDNLICAYCGDSASEWDHFRPLVSGKMPTGYISEIRNLVPACGKCNQSKGNKYWKDWMLSDAKLSPKSRKIQNLSYLITRLEKYEKWCDLSPLNFKEYIDIESWNKHWENRETLFSLLKEHQKLASQIKNVFEQNIKKNR